MSAVAVVKRASKPFWMAREAMATARWVFPVPVGPLRTSPAPWVTNSGPKKLPRSASRTALWRVKSYSSIVLRKGEASAAYAALDARLGAVGDLLGDEQGQEVAVAKALALGPLREVGVEPPHGRQVQAAKQAVEVDDGRRRGHRAAWLAGPRASRVRTYSAPIA